MQRNAIIHRQDAIHVACRSSLLITFVHDKDCFLLGEFQQNPLQNIRPGFAAEMRLVAIPDKVFAASIAGVSEILAQGPLLSSILAPGHLGTWAPGHLGTWAPVAMIRKVPVRIMSWENYLFSFMG